MSGEYISRTLSEMSVLTESSHLAAALQDLNRLMRKISVGKLNLRTMSVEWQHRIMQKEMIAGALSV